MKFKILLGSALIALGLSTSAIAEDFVIDKKGQHASINFKIQHLGFSWLIGRFNSFDGTFSYDEKNPSAAKVQVSIDTASVDSNHAERDKHLRSPDFLNVGAHPTATFVSNSFKELGNGKAELAGAFTLNGVTRDIIINVNHIGAGADPWGGYRRGFEGFTTLKLVDYNLAKANILGAASQELELHLYIEGVRQ
ncbi:MAG: YceI family protein [Mariprofundaceae bacterium]